MGIWSKIKKVFKPKQLEKLVNPVALIKGEERRWNRLTGKYDKVQTGPALDLPATAEEMQIASVMEMDRQRMIAIQSLALSRIRDSVTTLSRETGFQERPVEAFAQAPLYIPQYRQWSNTLGKLVGTDAPSGPITPHLSRRSAHQHWQRASNTGEQALRALRGETVMSEAGSRPLTYEDLRARLSMEGWAGAPWLTYLDEYSKWQQAQRELPA